MIRVLLDEDRGVRRGALALLRRREPDIDVVVEVGSRPEVLPAIWDTRPDMALPDIELPGASGLEAAAELRREQRDCKVPIATPFGRAWHLQRAMKAGPSGFLVKEELAAAIRQVLAGERVIDQSLGAVKQHLRGSPVRCLSAAIGKTDARNRIETVQAAGS
jgi:two-component system response regulator DesR